MQTSTKLTVAEKITAAENEKQIGNDQFRNGNIRSASKKYHFALLYLKDIETPSPLDKMAGNNSSKLTDEELSIVKDLRSTCYNNLAACLLKNEKYEKVIEYTTKSLENKPGNIKALFRRGQAYFALKNTEKAENDFLSIKEIDSKETCVDKYFPQIENAKCKQLKNEKEIYRKMMGAT